MLGRFVIGSRVVEIYRNTSEKRWGSGKLPIRQRLFWVGPLFVATRPQGDGK